MLLRSRWTLDAGGYLVSIFLKIGVLLVYSLLKYLKFWVNLLLDSIVDMNVYNVSIPVRGPSILVK